jgi:hypothetical protein
MFSSSAVLAVTAVGLALVATSARPAASDTIPNNVITTVSTSPTAHVELTARLATASFAMANMAPGDKVTAPITVANTGTLAQLYSVTSVTTENRLAGQLELTIKTGVTRCTDEGFGRTGIVAYSAGDLGSTAGTQIIGDSLQGQQAGDRLLAPAVSEVLCAQVLLPTSTTNAFQNLTTAATLTFNAEEAINNR